MAKIMFKFMFKLRMLKVRIYLKCLHLLRKIGLNILISNKEKECMIAIALCSDEGRHAMAEAMIGGVKAKIEEGKVNG